MKQLKMIIKKSHRIQSRCQLPERIHSKRVTLGEGLKMAKIIDKATSKPRMQNSVRCWGWEVTTEERDDRSDDYVRKIEAVFFDPWKATEYATKHYGIASGVRASIYDIDRSK